MSSFIARATEAVKLGDTSLKLQGLRAFPESAQRILEDLRLHEVFDLQGLILQSLSPSFERDQNFKFFEFSDLPLTVARGDSCFLDLYFWRRRPTTVHNHHFSGAFQCLQGSNLELEFSFKEQRRLGVFHTLGELTLEHEAHLSPGSIVEIHPNDEFIHQNHHHDDLCVNLCFRTPDLPHTNIANFLFSGLRYEKDHELLTKAERLRRFLLMQNLDLENIDFTSDEMLSFLLSYHGHGSMSESFTRTISYFTERLREKLNIDVAALLDSHDRRLSAIEDQYD